MANILIVEDDNSIQDILEEVLKKIYKTYYAYSGTEALLVLEKENIDLMLPGLSGEEIITKVKNIPIIVITAKIDAEDKVKCLLKGANDYITKPFDIKELLARIKVQLRLNINSNKKYATDKGKKVITDALKRRGLNRIVIKDAMTNYYIVKYKLKTEPLISIIISTRDYADTLEVCLKSIYSKTTYKNFEIILADNDSVEDKTLELFDRYKSKYNNFRVIPAKFEFNYSKINNLAVKEAKGEYIVLLNNDTEIISKDWLEWMVGYAALNHVGCVGAKLLYPSDSNIQHAGVILGLGGVASHAYIGSRRTDAGIYGRLKVPYNYSANTAACLMVKKEKYLEVNGLNEDLKVAYNDIDFNLELLKKGYYNVFLPQVELFHYESKSRGLDTTSEKYKLFLSESKYMWDKWQNVLLNDCFYNPNFSKNGWFVLDKKSKATSSRK